MQKIKFFVEDKERNKLFTYGETDNFTKFREIIQYLLDNTNDAEDVILLDTSNGNQCQLGTFAKWYGMRKRTFAERMEDAVTGNFDKLYEKEAML